MESTGELLTCTVSSLRTSLWHVLETNSFLIMFVYIKIISPHNFILFCCTYYPIIQIIREISKKVSQIQNRELALTVVKIM